MRRRTFVARALTTGIGPVENLEPLLELSKLVFYLGGTGALITAAFAVHRFITTVLLKLEDMTNAIRELNSSIGSVVKTVAFIEGRLA
jgi:hypothetical protein